MDSDSSLQSELTEPSEPPNANKSTLDNGIELGFRDIFDPGACRFLTINGWFARIRNTALDSDVWELRNPSGKEVPVRPEKPTPWRARQAI